MAVAKSYQGLKQLGQPYAVNGKMYVKVETVKGGVRQVRWYSDAEYAKMYGEAPTPNAKPKTEKEALGFANGFIHIFKGDTYAALEWFRASVCKYNKIFGWYCPSTEDLPRDIPIGIDPIEIRWSDVCAEDQICLKNETAVKEWCAQFLYEPSDSEFIGNIGDRIEVVVTVEKAIEMNGYYGRSTMHVMHDYEGNVIMWTTSAKQLVEGNEYTLRGTIKDHKVYKNEKQTVLTRCMVLN